MWAEWGPSGDGGLVPSSALSGQGPGPISAQLWGFEKCDLSFLICKMGLSSLQLRAAVRSRSAGIFCVLVSSFQHSRYSMQVCVTDEGGAQGGNLCWSPLTRAVPHTQRALINADKMNKWKNQ